MKFGICSFAYRWAIGRPYYRPAHPMSIYDFIDKARGLGVKNVILCNNCELVNYSNAELKSLSGYCKSMGVEVETGARESLSEEFFKALDIAALFGSCVMRIVCDVDGGEAERLDKTRELISAVLPRAQSMGISLAIENGPGMMHGEIIELISYFNSPWLGACLDSMNCVYAVYRPVEVFRALAPYAKTVHFKDYSIVPNKRGYVIKGVALGEGEVDFPALIGYLKDAGYAGNAYLELYIDRKETEEETLAFEEDCVIKSLEYAKSIGLL